METDLVLSLFDEFAQRFARSESPAVLEYIERAGESGDELATMLNHFLATAPPPQPSAERVEMMRAWIAGKPPILELRKQRGLTRDVVVERLLGLLGLRAERGAKVRGYYHELETGLLEPRGVDRRVWVALGQVLGVSVSDLAGWRPRRIEGTPAFRVRPDEFAGADIRVSAPISAPEPAEEDEVDRLFTGAGQ
jgi:transcriptional regulator with XRE-family HTH domain